MNKSLKLHAVLICMVVTTLSAPAQSDKFFGTIWQRWDSVRVIPANFTRFFNQVTAENAGKWGPCEPTRGQFIWQRLDAMYAWGDSTGCPVKHHCFVWGQQEPSWIGSYSNADTVKAIVTNWITMYLKRYGTRTDLIDVVNEPLHAKPSFVNQLGGSGTTGWDWVIWVFQTTRNLCNVYAPDAKLLLNDYSIIGNDAATTNFLKIITLLKERNLIDGIGEQAHFYETTDSAVLRRNLNRLAATGLPVYISELDISVSSDQEQLNAYKKIFPVFWDNPAVKGVTLWGYLQGTMWRVNGYLVRSDGTERPAFTWLREYVAKTPVIHSARQGAPVGANARTGRITFGRGNGSHLMPMVQKIAGNDAAAFTLNGSRLKRINTSRSRKIK